VSELNPIDPQRPRADDDNQPIQSTNPYLIGDPEPLESQSDGVQFVDDGIVQAEIVDTDSDVSIKEEGKRIGMPSIAWVVIAAIVILIVLRPLLSPNDDATADGKSANELELRMMEIQGKYFIGAAELAASDEEQQKKFYEGVAPLDAGTLHCFRPRE